MYGMPDSLQLRPGDLLEKRTGAGLLPPFHRRSILLFCAATFFYWMTLYFYVPILPVYAHSLGASLSLVGLVIASYALPQMLFRIPLGMWFDTLNRRKPLVAVGIVVTAVGALGLGLAPHTWFLFLARVATGIGASSWVLFTVYFAAYYPRERMGRAIGVINFVNGLAMVVATSSGGLVAEMWGFRSTFFGAALLGVISLIALLFTTEPVAHKAERISRHDLIRVATHPTLLVVSFMSILLYFTTFASVFGFVPIYAVKIGASSADLGIITMLTLASSAVAMLLVMNIAERWGNPFAIMLGSTLMGTALLAVPFVQNVSVLAAVQIVYGLGRGGLFTLLMALSIRAVAPQQRATAMGVYQALYAVGTLLGPLVSGYLADSLSLAVVFYLSASLCVVIAVMTRLPMLPKH